MGEERERENERMGTREAAKEAGYTDGSNFDGDSFKIAVTSLTFSLGY